MPREAPTFQCHIPREYEINPSHIRHYPFQWKLRVSYNTQYLKAPYQLLMMMIFQLYGEENNVHFKLEWVPLDTHITIVEGKFLTWPILYQTTSPTTLKVPPPIKNQFFICMSFYLMHFVLLLLFLRLIGIRMRIHHLFMCTSQNCGKEIIKSTFMKPVTNSWLLFLSCFRPSTHTVDPGDIEALKDIGD
jgi:hypothetical protein